MASRQAPPHDTYKTTFIIAARQRADISDAMIESVDVVRRYWDPAHSAATGGLRCTHPRRMTQPPQPGGTMA